MKLRGPIVSFVAVAIGLGLYFVVPGVIGASRGKATPPALLLDYDRFDYRRQQGDQTVHIGMIPTGVSSLFTMQSLFHDGVLQGQLAARGWKLKAFDYRSGKDLLPYADGRLDILTIGDTEALLAIHRCHVGIYAVIRQGLNAIIARRRITPSELKGLRIGYTPGTTLHFTLERALETAGLTLKDIVSVPMVPDEMEAALRSGRVDAVSTLEPFTSVILSQVPGSAAISSFDSYTYLLASKDFAKHHPEVLKAVLAGVVRAARWGRANDENLRTALGWVRQANLRFIGKSSVDASPLWLGVLHRETIDNASFPMLPLNARREGSLQHRQFDYLKRTGLLPGRAEWRETRGYFCPEVLSEVIRDGHAWGIEDFQYASARLKPGGGAQP